ncbi:MAG: hypothetical protein U0793_03790 [Gemmataceae bacterium]
MIDTTIRVRGTQAAADRYRDLLDSDWSGETLDEALSLLWELIAASATGPVGWMQTLSVPASRRAAKDFDPTILARIRDLSSVFHEPSIPAAPQRWTATRPSRLAEQAWGYLLLQALARLEGDTGLFQDAQSLLFLCAAHVLLPQLRRQGLTAERDCLACAMYIHTLLVWRTQQPHLLHLQSVLMDELGAQERRLDLLDMSFLLTSPQDHTYLTRATSYWSELMNLGRQEQAADFLFYLTKHAPDSCQEEIKIMLAETFAGNGVG